MHTIPTLALALVAPAFPDLDPGTRLAAFSLDPASVFALLLLVAFVVGILRAGRSGGPPSDRPER